MKNPIKIFHITLSVLIVTLTFLCVFQIVGITQEKYLAQKYQRAAFAAAEENSSGPQEEGNGLSLEKIEQMAKERGFTVAGNITYVKISGSEVVVVR